MEMFKEIEHFHFMPNSATPKHNDPCTRGQELYNLGRPSVVHHYYILSVSGLSSPVGMPFSKERMYFQYMTKYGHALAQEPPPGGYEIYNVCRPFLCIITKY